MATAGVERPAVVGPARSQRLVGTAVAATGHGDGASAVSSSCSRSSSSPSASSGCGSSARCWASSADTGTLSDLARAAVAVILVAGGVAILFGIRLARGVGPPLDALVEAARRVEAGDYATRVPEVDRGPRELRDLVRAFNTMTARLEVDEVQRRRLLAEVSHELRTPLASSRATSKRSSTASTRRTRSTSERSSRRRGCSPA